VPYKKNKEVCFNSGENDHFREAGKRLATNNFLSYHFHKTRSLLEKLLHYFDLTNKVMSTRL
jgi:hypothetical protein